MRHHREVVLEMVGAKRNDRYFGFGDADAVLTYEVPETIALLTMTADNGGSDGDDEEVCDDAAGYEPPSGKARASR